MVLQVICSLVRGESVWKNSSWEWQSAIQMASRVDSFSDEMSVPDGFCWGRADGFSKEMSVVVCSLAFMEPVYLVPWTYWQLMSRRTPPNYTVRNTNGTERNANYYRTVRAMRTRAVLVPFSNRFRFVGTGWHGTKTVTFYWPVLYLLCCAMCVCMHTHTHTHTHTAVCDHWTGLVDWTTELDY